MKRVEWVVGCAVVVWTVSAMPLLATAQFGGGEGEVVVADDPFGAPAADPAAGPTAESAVAAANDFCRCVGEASGKTVDKINSALDEPVISAGMEFQDQALDAIVATLQNDYEIPIQLDIPALDAAGIGSDESVTISLRNLSLRSALRLMLKQKQLTYMIQDEVLIITTPEEAEAQLLVCVYDVRDLKGKSLPAAPARGTSSRANFDPLIDMIVSCVATERWAENGGGEAEIRPLQPGLLIIAQTQAVHEKIRALLRTIRATLAEDNEGQSAATETADGDEIVARHYILHIMDDDSANEYRAQVSRLIVQLTPGANWDAPLADGQTPILTALPDRIVVRHKESVQDDVQAALQDLGLVSPWQGAAAGQGSGGGFGGGGGGGMFRWPPESK